MFAAVLVAGSLAAFADEDIVLDTPLAPAPPEA
jgi:hypothetical protein